MPPNILLIVLDTARADALEPYGAAPGTSPALAQLAARGAALHGRATACWTVPSHASIFTGLLPRASGLIRAPAGSPHSCRAVLEAQRERLLPEVLRRAGYWTGGVSTNMWLIPASGFATGFDRFEMIDSRRQAKLHEGSLPARLAWRAEVTRARVDDGAAAAAGVLERWADDPPGGRGRPFFWFVNLVECHSPYLPPRPYNDLGPIDRWRAAEDARRYQTMGAIWQACAGGLEVPGESLERMRHLYGRSVRMLDDWVARVVSRLETAGVLDETLVIVCSDHGENFGEDGLMGHAFSLDERLTRVPLIVAGPQAPRDEGPVSLAELPRLIANAAGIDDHPWDRSLPPAGVAVAQFDPPAPRDDPSWDAALAAWGVGAEVKERLAQPITSATDGRLKLVRHGDRELAYDLEADPFAARPLAGAADSVELARLREALAHPAAMARAETPAAAEQPEIPEDEMRELEERMKLLGYM